VSLAEKLLVIQGIARKVAKRGVNPEQGWEYLQIEDAVEWAKRQMKRHKLILTASLLPNTLTRTANEKGSGYVIDLVLCWTLLDLESGEERQFDIPGSGWDYSDKGVFKAMTGSRKYAIVLIFNLAVGNDVEERGAIEKTTGLARQKEIVREKLEAGLNSHDAHIRETAEQGLANLDTPAQLFWQWFEASSTALITGDKELMKQNADVLKALRLGGKVIAKAEDLERLKAVLLERNIPFTQLHA
jgi:hypothetical protein